MSSAIVLFAHGARDAEWALPFEKIAALVRVQHPHTPVMLAFLELMQPSLQDAVDMLATQEVRYITLIPMFLARGGHLKQDLPRLIMSIQKRHPTMNLHLAPAIGEVDSVLKLLSDWVCAEYRDSNHN